MKKILIWKKGFSKSKIPETKEDTVIKIEDSIIDNILNNKGKTIVTIISKKIILKLILHINISIKIFIFPLQ